MRYLLGAENWSIRSVFDYLAKLTGLPEPRWRVPYPVALAAAYVSEFVADAVTGRIPAATVTGVKLTRRRMHFDASRSLAELGITPRPARESIAEAVAWFKEVGWLMTFISRSRTMLSASFAVRLMISWRVPSQPKRVTSVPAAWASATYAVPTGFSSVPPVGPAKPVVATPRSVPNSRAHALGHRPRHRFADRAVLLE